jgi:hypothetical protein
LKRVYQPIMTSGWEWALPSNEDDNLTIAETFGTPLRARWTPMNFRLIKQDERGRSWKDADLPWIGAHALVLKPRAASVLRDLCLQAGELLPLTCPEADLVAWNVTTVVDALDEEKSKLIRFPGGRVMSIQQHCFKPPTLEGVVAFRIPQVRTAIFLSPEFAERAKAARLTGTAFHETWPIN